MKAKIRTNEFDQNIIGYEDDWFAHPETFKELEECENVTLGYKLAPSIYEVYIDERKYMVSRGKQKTYGIPSKFLFVISDITNITFNAI